MGWHEGSASCESGFGLGRAERLEWVIARLREGGGSRAEGWDRVTRVGTDRRAGPQKGGGAHLKSSLLDVYGTKRDSGIMLVQFACDSRNCQSNPKPENFH